MDQKIEYTEEEFEERGLYIAECMQKDVLESVSYDEWTAREYGEYTVDSYDMAFNLYDKGYRREKDVLKKLLLEKLEPAAQCKGHDEDALDMFMDVVRKLRQDLDCYPEWESDVIKENGYGI